MKTQNFRYPGVQPFQRSQSDRFFGRDEDIERCLSLILQEKLSVLYSKSGFGKSSLLNAGIHPRLELENIKGKRRCVAVPLRFLASGGQGEDNLFEQFNFHLTRAMEAANIKKAEDTIALPRTLWGCFKSWQTDPATVFVLLFDQFEEIFSYKAEHQLTFRQQLAELLYSDYPQFLEENESQLSPETVVRLAKKTIVHTVLAIRSDRVSELDRMRDHLPKIREKWLELRALPIEEACRSLTTPSDLPGEFASPVFKFDKSAQHKILDFLVDTDGLIDPIQLQILAESFEQRVINENIKSFDADNIGNLPAIIAQYYSDKIAAIADPSERHAVRRLCEEGLAQEGEPPIRLSLHATQIKHFFGIEPQLLVRLVDARLLRAEAGKGGAATYELPHDTLLGAVLEAKKERLEEERRLAEAQLEIDLKAAREEAARERKQRQRATLLALGAGLAALLAIGLTWFAREKMMDAEQATYRANVALGQALQAQISRFDSEIEASRRKIEVYRKASESQLIELETTQMNTLKLHRDSAIFKLKNLKTQ